MPASGTPRFNTLVIAKVTVDLTRTPSAITAEAAFVNDTTGHTHGWTRGDGGVWSEETRTRLRALCDSMERDLAKMHFSDGVVAASPGNGAVEQGGLAEYLGNDAESL